MLFVVYDLKGMSSLRLPPPALCFTFSKTPGLIKGMTIRMNMLINHHKGRSLLAVLLIYIQIKGRTILMKNRYTTGQAVPKKRNIGEPRALPSCLSSSLSGASPHAPPTPARQDIKHPIIEAHYGV